MGSLPRKLRGAAAIALTFGILWAAAGVAAVAVLATIRPQDIDAGEGPLDAGRIIGTAGLICGSAFAALLWLVERRRGIGELPLLRAALWSLPVAAAFPLLTEVDDSMVLLTCPLGALSAVAAAALARAAAALRGEDRIRLQPR